MNHDYLSLTPKCWVFLLDFNSVLLLRDFSFLLFATALLLVPDSGDSTTHTSSAETSATPATPAGMATKHWWIRDADFDGFLSDELWTSMRCLSLYYKNLHPYYPRDPAAYQPQRQSRRNRTPGPDISGLRCIVDQTTYSVPIVHMIPGKFDMDNLPTGSTE